MAIIPIGRTASRQGEERRKKIKFELGIENFGPISSGKITLKPLTVFIGPNNSGKSYAAMLIHSVFKSFPAVAFYRRVPHFLMRNSLFTEYFDIPDLLKKFPDLGKQIDRLKEGEELEIPKQFIVEITNRIFEEVYKKKLSDEITYSYACRLGELVRIRNQSFELKVNVNSCNTCLEYLKKSKDGLRIKEYPRWPIKIRVKPDKSCRHPLGKVRGKGKSEIFVDLGRLLIEKEGTRLIYYYLTDVILQELVSRIFKNVAMPCYYLPAARSGILQGHKAIAASIVMKAPYAGIERIEIPRFSGVVSNFISSIITLSEEKGSFYKLAQDFEKELIKGEIVLRASDKNLSEIKYSFQKTEIPLDRASSSVSELAPLFLYLKYIVEPGSILIIEEPEAHLHPENQRILAKFLVKLIRNDVNIVITTHSDYLLGQLSSFILLSKVEEKKRVEKYSYSKEDFLESNEVSAYVFAYDKKSAGHKISEVEITEEDGISDEEFIKIHEALYEETVKIRKDLDTET